jgi:hypothetical protein
MKLAALGFSFRRFLVRICVRCHYPPRTSGRPQFKPTAAILLVDAICEGAEYFYCPLASQRASEDERCIYRICVLPALLEVEGRCQIALVTRQAYYQLWIRVLS